MSESTHDLLVRGVAAAKAKDIEEARFYLEWLLRLEAPLEERNEAWFYLSEITPDRHKQRDYLEEILSTDPGDARARRKLAILDGKLDPAHLIDANRYTQPAPESPIENPSRDFTCPNCGGRMVYSPDGQSLVCEYCESRARHSNNRNAVSPNTRPAVPEEDFIIALSTARGHSRPMTSHRITCQGCGAVFIFSPTQISGSCPYCATPCALERFETGQIDEPDGLIPFEINEDQARESLKAWFSQQKFPAMPRVAPGHGVYLPVWDFSVGGTVRWKGTVLHGKGQRIPVEGAHIVDYPNVTVLASRRLPEAILEGIWAFDLSGLVPFSPDYLAAWMAETYAVSPSEASLHAREYALTLERQVITASAPANVENLSIDSAHMLVTAYKLILVPVWLTHYWYEEKLFTVLINGQTGQVFAEKPAQGLPRTILGWVGEWLDQA